MIGTLVRSSRTISWRWYHWNRHRVRYSECWWIPLRLALSVKGLCAHSFSGAIIWWFLQLYLPELIVRLTMGDNSHQKGKQLWWFLKLCAYPSYHPVFINHSYKPSSFGVWLEKPAWCFFLMVERAIVGCLLKLPVGFIIVHLRMVYHVKLQGDALKCKSYV